MSNEVKKSNLRVHFKNQMGSHKLTEFEEKQLRAWITHSLPKKGIVASYWPLLEEANPGDSVESERVCYPKVMGDDIQFYKSRKFQKNKWSILEPEIEKSELISKESISSILVPGVAYDRRGFRLGRGKGFYDRYLKDFKGLKVGVAKSSQIYNDDLPVDEWDISMDLIVTEKFLYQPTLTQYSLNKEY